MGNRRMGREEKRREEGMERRLCVNRRVRRDAKRLHVQQLYVRSQ